MAALGHGMVVEGGGRTGEVRPEGTGAGPGHAYDTVLRMRGRV